MSRRRNVERKLHSQGEIREIMNSMKTLSYMETRKLTRFLDAQQQSVQTIEDAAADFIGFYPETLPPGDGECVCLLIGSERGFCGDFNQRVAQAFLQDEHIRCGEGARLIVVGHKLHALFEDDSRVCAMLAGASVAEEVTAALSSIASTLASLHHEVPNMTLKAVFHPDDDSIALRTLLPAFRDVASAATPRGYAPVLNLAPEAFMLELGEHYLFAALQQLLYASLMAENHSRVAHLDGAVRHLDEQSDGLKRRMNELRQEEIIEEIETILLNAGTPGIDWRHARG